MTPIPEETVEAPAPVWKAIPMSADEAQLLRDGGTAIMRPVEWPFPSLESADLGLANRMEGGRGVLLRVPCYNKKEWEGHHEPAFDRQEILSCPFGYPKARLFIQEPWRISGLGEKLTTISYRCGGFKTFKRPASALFPGEKISTDWRGITTMPRWASRLAFRLLDVRLTRIRALEVADLYRTGFVPQGGSTLGFSSPADAARDKLRLFWNNRYEAKYAYMTNCWIWILDLKRIPTRWKAPGGERW